MRASDYPIHPLILNRWSPRAMSEEPLLESELLPLFEAARWAPSCYNEQPWRFIYAMRDTSAWSSLFELLVPFNKSWCKNAGALIVIASRTVSEKNGKPLSTHSFDAGAAWENFALEGAARHLVVHGMQGFNYEKAQEVCEIEDNWVVEAMIAVGKLGNLSNLPKEVQEKEMQSNRKPLSEIVFDLNKKS